MTQEQRIQWLNDNWGVKRIEEDGLDRLVELDDGTHYRVYPDGEYEEVE